jgi:hypothetical protein
VINYSSDEDFVNGVIYYPAVIISNEAVLSDVLALQIKKEVRIWISIHSGSVLRSGRSSCIS